MDEITNSPFVTAKCNERCKREEGLKKALLLVLRQQRILLHDVSENHIGFDKRGMYQTRFLNKNQQL